MYRQKVIEWHEVVTAEAKKGKDMAAILKTLRSKDKELDYLDDLEEDVYAREASLIYNSIRGLAGPDRKE